MKSKKEAHIVAQINSLEKSKNSSEFWKIINSYRKKTNTNIGGIPLEKWFDHLCNLFPPEFPTLQIQLLGNFIESLDRDITLEEVQLNLQNLKNNKAPGPDKSTYEFYKNIPEAGVEYLTFIFNKSLKEERVPHSWVNIVLKMLYKKGEKLDPENYRPIALVNSILKILTTILNNRLMDFAEDHGLLPEYQSGFRKKRSCLDNVFILNSMIQVKLRQKRGRLFALFVDFKSAFPSVRHDILWSKLHKLGVSSRFINLFKDIYRKASIAVESNDEYTPFTKVTGGILQGETTSPLFFSLLIADLESFMRENGVRGVSINQLTEILLLGYADDLIFFADSQVMMNKILSLLCTYCKENGL